MIRLSALYLLCCTSPAYSVDCGRAITQFQFKAEDVRSLVMQSDAVVQAIVVSPNNPPMRAAIDWLIPFAQSIEAAKGMLAIYRVVAGVLQHQDRRHRERHRGAGAHP